MATLHAFFGQSKKGASASASRSSLGVSPLQSPPARKAASSADTRESKRPRVNDVEPARRAPTPASAPVILGGNVFLHQSLKFLNEDLRDGQGRRVGTEGYDRTTLKVPTSIQGVAVDKGQWKSLFTDGGKQWWNIKKDNFDAVLLFKQGKFYEMFNMDAEVRMSCCVALLGAPNSFSVGRLGCGSWVSSGWVILARAARPMRASPRCPSSATPSSSSTVTTV